MIAQLLSLKELTAKIVATQEEELLGQLEQKLVCVLLVGKVMTQKLKPVLLVSSVLRKQSIF